MAEDGYEVGYGKPPHKSRFEKGRSGNPKGRPKGSKNFATDVRDMLNAKVGVSENGTKRKVTSQKATLMRLREQALQGDARAIKQFLDLAKDQAVEESSRKNERSLSKAEDDILERFVNEHINAASGNATKDILTPQKTEGDLDEQ